MSRVPWKNTSDVVSFLVSTVGIDFPQANKAATKLFDNGYNSSFMVSRAQYRNLRELTNMGVADQILFWINNNPASITPTRTPKRLKAPPTTTSSTANMISMASSSTANMISNSLFADAELDALFIEAADKAKRMKKGTLKVKGVCSRPNVKWLAKIYHNHNLTGRSKRYNLCSADKDLTKVIYYRLLGEAAKAKGLNPVKTIADITNNNNFTTTHGYTWVRNGGYIPYDESSGERRPTKKEINTYTYDTLKEMLYNLKISSSSYKAQMTNKLMNHYYPITNNKRSNGGSGHGAGDSLLIGSGAKGGDYSTMSTTTTTATAGATSSRPTPKMWENSYNGVRGDLESALGGDYSQKSTDTQGMWSCDSVRNIGREGATNSKVILLDSDDDRSDDDDDDNDNDDDDDDVDVNYMDVGFFGNELPDVSGSKRKWHNMGTHVLVTDNGGKGRKKIKGEGKKQHWSKIDPDTKHVTVHQPDSTGYENIKFEFSQTENKTLRDHKSDFGRFTTNYFGNTQLENNKYISTMHAVIDNKPPGVFDIAREGKKHRGEIDLVVGKIMELLNYVQNATKYFDDNELATVQDLFQQLELKIKTDAKSFLFLNHVDEEVVGLVNTVNCFHMINDTGPFLQLLKMCIKGNYGDARQWLKNVEFSHTK